MVVQDRAGHLADFQLERLNARAVKAVLEPLMAPDAILCSDGAGVYASFSMGQGITSDWDIAFFIGMLTGMR